MKKNYIYKYILTAIAIFFSYFFIKPADVWADGEMNNSMFVTPMSQKILLIPGESYEGIISVSNAANAQNDLNYTVEVGPYGLTKDDDGNIDYSGIDVSTRSARNVIMNWITLDSTSGTVEPNGTKEIQYTINVPLDAPAGAQYASILVIYDNNSDKSEEDNVMISETYQLASAIIANVAGETVEKGSISDNSIPSFLLNNQLEATSMVRNEGNVYTDAEYILQVWPLFSDEEICTNEEEPETSLVLPETERYHSQSCALPSVGIFRAKQTVKIFGEESIVEKTIIVCPIWLLFIIFFAIAAIIIWLVMKARSRKSTNSRKTSAE